MLLALNAGAVASARAPSQVTVTHLEELQQAKDDEMQAMRDQLGLKLAEREADATRLEGELADLRKQRQTMALSLAQYATLEAQWGQVSAGVERDRTQ